MDFDIRLTATTATRRPTSTLLVVVRHHVFLSCRDHETDSVLCQAGEDRCWFILKTVH